MSGKIAQRVAEYNLTEHCNLKCAGCDHSSPLLPKKFADLAQFQRDLIALSQVMHLGELRLLGGEPLLHPYLLAFLESARESRLADEITLVTNGVLLHHCDPKTFELINRLRVSLYPGIRLRIETRELEALSRRHNFRLELRRYDSFRFTTINKRHEDAALVEQIFKRCEFVHSWSCHTIHEGYYFKCSPAPFLTTRLALRDEAVVNRDLDGVRIHENPRLREELEAYLSAEEPLEACYYCLGSSGRSFPHRQLNAEELHEALNASHTELETLGMIARHQRDRWVIRLTSICKPPFKRGTYLWLLWAILPHIVTQIISWTFSARLRKSLSGSA
jgi:organic radical activating enzyme